MIHKTTRSILSVLLAALLLVTSTPLTPAFAGEEGAVSPQSESGEGRVLEQADDGKYYISTAEQLKEFADKVNDDSGKYTDIDAELTDDIDLSEICSEEKGDSWTPIGTDINPYRGTFNGDGHTISGLYINSSSDNYQGLFGYVGTDGTDGTVKDLTVSGSVKGDDYVGGVVGYNRGRVENCHNIGSVSGDRYVGGVVGDNRGTVENCHNIGEVSGNRVGGVVGYNNGGTVENCYNTGKVSGPDSGSVSGGTYVGGVVGLNRGTVENCYNTGTVSSNSNTSDVGGVVGFNGGTVDNGGTVENCYNTGTVTGSSNYVGGVVGYNSSIGNVKNCYNTGKVIGSSVGGVVGNNDGSVTGCYFLKQNPEIPGIGGGDTDRQTAEPVDNLDALCENFKSDPWTISDTLKRPVLTSNHEDDGSKDHPYEIFTADQLETFRDLVNGGEKSAHAKLMNDIDLKDVCEPELDAETSWTPIGNDAHQYIGTFDGQNFKISGLYIDTTADYQGLFGYVDPGGTVQNLTVFGSVKGDWYVGGVVGYNNGGTVTGCIFSGSGSVSGSDYVGGVVGENSGSSTVENCYNTGTVTGPDSVNGETTVNVGGVVGYNSSSSSVENCYNTGAVNSSGNSSVVGGVVGWNDSGANVENCYNTGSVNVSGNSSVVGGVVGYNSGSVENCYNIGDVTGNNYVGGVVGDNYSSVTNCYNIGDVSGSEYVGGVVGNNHSGGSVTNSYNTGEVSGNKYVGGVVGYNDSNGNVTGCYFLQTDTVNVNLPDIGKNDGSGSATAKDNTAFHSGEVAWRLQDGQTAGSGQVWGQNIKDGENDNYPQLRAFDADTPQVYKVAFMNDSEEHDAKYANSGMTVGSPTTNPTKEGYTFAGWFTKTSGGSQWNFSTAVTKNMTLYAQWTPVAEPEEPPYTGKYSYELTTSVGDHGSLTVDRYATEGDTVTIQVTPDQAYKLDDLSVTANGKDVELTANSDGTYSFTMPSADVKITATFAEDPDWTPDEPEEPTTDVSDIFVDVAPNAWYKDAVQYAYDQGLMTGVSDTEFAPEATTTRAMIVSILARLEGVESAEAAGFADVDDEWYATAVNWAANVGVVNGYEDNTFRPNTAITREQLAAILMNYASYKGYDVSARADLSHYSDADSISSWANDVLLWAVAEGLLTGVTDDTIAPQAHATRAQVAAILQRFLSE